MRRRLFLAIAAGLIPGLRGQNPSSGQNGAPTEQDPVAPPKAQTPAELFPLTRDEEKLLPAFKHFTHSKEQFVPFAFKDPIAKGVALVGAGFNLHATETIHPAKYEYNNRKRKDPSAETLWKVSGVPENLEELRTNAVSNTRARAYLYLKKAGKDPVIQKKQPYLKIQQKHYLISACVKRCTMPAAISNIGSHSLHIRKLLSLTWCIRWALISKVLARCWVKPIRKNHLRPKTGLQCRPSQKAANGTITTPTGRPL
jgi:hypothetical protein